MVSGFLLYPFQFFGDGPAIEGVFNTGAGSCPRGMPLSILPMGKWNDVRISSVHVKSSVMGLVLRAASILAQVLILVEWLLVYYQSRIGMVSGFLLYPFQVFGDGPAIEGGFNTVQVLVLVECLLVFCQSRIRMVSGFLLCPCQVFGGGPAIECGFNTCAGSGPCRMDVSLFPLRNWDDVRIYSVHVKSSVIDLLLRATSILAQVLLLVEWLLVFC